VYTANSVYPGFSLVYTANSVYPGFSLVYTANSVYPGFSLVYTANSVYPGFGLHRFHCIYDNRYIHIRKLNSKTTPQSHLNLFVLVDKPGCLYKN
jgi:hypothetical protein